MPINKTQLDKVLAAYAAMRDKGRATTTIVAGQPLELQTGETPTPQGQQSRKPIPTPQTPKQG